MRVEPYIPHHLRLIYAQGVQGAQLGGLSLVPEVSDRLQILGPAVTAFHGDRVLVVGGMYYVRKHYGVLWAVISAAAGEHMLAIHRATERFLSCQSVKRLEATVEQGFEPGCRWLNLLGFNFEGLMPGYGMGGETHLRYGRVA